MNCKWETYKKWLVAYLLDKEPEQTYSPKVGEVWFMKFYQGGPIYRREIMGWSEGKVLSVKDRHPDSILEHYQLNNIILLGKADV